MPGPFQCCDAFNSSWQTPTTCHHNADQKLQYAATTHVNSVHFPPQVTLPQITEYLTRCTPSRFFHKISVQILADTQYGIAA